MRDWVGRASARQAGDGEASSPLERLGVPGRKPRRYRYIFTFYRAANLLPREGGCREGPEVIPN